MFEGDKAYQGGKNISIPYKKPRKGELTSEQKARNKEFSSKGIFVEEKMVCLNPLLKRLTFWIIFELVHSRRLSLHKTNNRKPL